MSRIVVVDDHPVFRRGLIALLRAQGHDVMAEASDGVEAVAVVAAERPDVVLMDLSMPLRDGFEATAYITAAHPKTKVVVITLFDDEASVVRALEAGASGYVSKQADPDHILGAVDAVTHGAMWLGAGVARPALSLTVTEDLPGRLTAREATIADLLSRGLTNPMIAERLCLSTKTVANYVSTVLLKIGATNREEAARMVREARRDRSS
jgi:DNA-binding NarL/FixJ family response regulator